MTRWVLVLMYKMFEINRIDIKILNTKLEPVVLNSTYPIEILINIKKK